MTALPLEVEDATILRNVENRFTRNVVTSQKTASSEMADAFFVSLVCCEFSWMFVVRLLITL